MFELNVTSAEQAIEEIKVAAQTESKKECRRRILSVASESTQLNIASAESISILSDSERAIYVEYLSWVFQMRSTWNKLVESGKDLYDDDNWPEPSLEIIELLGKY